MPIAIVLAQKRTGHMALRHSNTMHLAQVNFCLQHISVSGDIKTFLSRMQYLLTEMAAMGVVPDVMTIGSMVYAYAEAKQPRRAAAVMQQYTDAGGEVSPAASALHQLIAHHVEPALP